MEMDLIEGVHYYYEDGYTVFTEKYHIDKGFCCGHACRHCPYDYESVPEPKRTIALEMRNEAAEKS
jgi:hypothetical protein